MSMMRLLLRTAFVKCLAGKTIAQDRVYDSKMTPVQSGLENQMLPFISVYTEDDTSKNIAGKGAHLPAFERYVDVVLEVGIGAWTLPQVDADGNQYQQYLAAQLDEEVEALLDLLEHQIMRAVFDTSPGADAKILRKYIKSIDDWSSRVGRARSEETNNRLSQRQITVACLIRSDCFKTQKFPTSNAVVEAQDIEPELLAAAPYLEPLLDIIVARPEFASLKQMLHEMGGHVGPTPEDQLLTVGATITNPKHGQEPAEHDNVVLEEAEWDAP